MTPWVQTHNLSISACILVSHCFCNKVPPMQWLKHDKFIILQCWKTEVSLGQNQDVGRASSVSPGGFRNQSVPCVFQLPEASHILWLEALSPLQRQQAHPSSVITSSVLRRPFFLPRHSGDYSVSTQINQDNLISSYLRWSHIYNAKSILWYDIM